MVFRDESCVDLKVAWQSCSRPILGEVCYTICWNCKTKQNSYNVPLLHHFVVTQFTDSVLLVHFSHIQFSFMHFIRQSSQSLPLKAVLEVPAEGLNKAGCSFHVHINVWILLFVMGLEPHCSPKRFIYLFFIFSRNVRCVSECVRMCL